VTEDESGKLLELAALALPAHPAAFGRVPAARPVEQHERGLVRIARVEATHARDQRCLDRRIFRRTLGIGVREVAQQRHADQRIGV
jgi:hypothetical protein